MRKLNIGPDGKYSADEWWGAGKERVSLGQAPPLFQKLDKAGARGVWVTRHEWLRFLSWAKKLQGWQQEGNYAVSIRWSA